MDPWLFNLFFSPSMTRGRLAARGTVRLFYSGLVYVIEGGEDLNQA